MDNSIRPTIGKSLRSNAARWFHILLVVVGAVTLLAAFLRLVAPWIFEMPLYVFHPGKTEVWISLSDEHCSTREFVFGRVPVEFDKDVETVWVPPGKHVLAGWIDGHPYAEVVEVGDDEMYLVLDCKSRRLKDDGSGSDGEVVPVIDPSSGTAAPAEGR